jgi:hypothetical protein
MFHLVIGDGDARKMRYAADSFRIDCHGIFPKDTSDQASASL